MYRVNLYRERKDRGVQIRKDVVRGSVVGVVLGIEAFFLVFLLISGSQLRERIDRAERNIADVQTRLRNLPPFPEVTPARKLVQTRIDRVDWSAVLEAVAQATPPNVVLSQIQGGTGDQPGSLDGMNIEGRVTGNRPDLSRVLDFVESLRAQELIISVFPTIDLDNAGGRNQQAFRIICRPEKEMGKTS